MQDVTAVGFVRTMCLGLLLCGVAGCGIGEIEIPEGDFVFDDPAPRNIRGPTVTVAANDKATCVWIGDGEVHAERFIPGVGWQREQEISDGTTSASDPDVATDADGNAVAVWEQDGVIVANTFEVGTGWTGPMTLSDSTLGAASHPEIAMNASGEGVVVWEQEGDLHARPVDASGGWLAPEVLDASPEVARDPQIGVAPDGDSVVVWERDSEEVAARTFDAKSGQWSPTVDLGAGANPDVAVDAAGNAVVAWENAGDVEVAQYVDDVAWTPAETIDVPAEAKAGRAHTPDVAVSPSGDAMVVFCVDDEVFASEHTPAGFEEAESIVPDTPSCGPGLTTMDEDGNVVVVFQDMDRTIQAVPYDKATGTWEEALVVGSGADPSLAGNDDGTAVTVYLSDYGVGGRVIDDIADIPSVTVTLTVSGAGTVESTPAGLDCDAGGPCVEHFIEGAYLRLQATPAPGFVFSSWIGCDGDPASSECDFFVTADRLVEARFVPQP